MGLLAHTLVEMSDSIPREISIESSTKEMKLGMVLGEFHKKWIILRHFLEKNNFGEK